MLQLHTVKLRETQHDTVATNNSTNNPTIYRGTKYILERYVAEQNVPFSRESTNLTRSLPELGSTHRIICL